MFYFGRREELPLTFTSGTAPGLKQHKMYHGNKRSIGPEVPAGHKAAN